MKHKYRVTYTTDPEREFGSGLRHEVYTCDVPFVTIAIFKEYEDALNFAEMKNSELGENSE